MVDRWEALAQADAEFHICPGPSKGGDFFGSGEREAERILAMVTRHMATWTSALEIGCGVGRLTIPMSRTFGRVTAVDIAPTMLRKLDDNCLARGVANVTPMLAGEAWELGGPVDLCYSRLVFQHIEPWGVIEDYFRRIGTCLTTGGVFYAQFDTRPYDVLYQIKNSLPDLILPRTKQRGLRRIRRTAEEVKVLAHACGLKTVHEQGAGTFDAEFVLRRSMLTRE